MEKSILIISSHYYPETGAGAKRATSFAEFLAQKGWKVAVITALPNYPFNEIYEGYDQETPYINFENGVRVVRLKPVLVPRENLVLRIVAEFIFSLRVLFVALKLKKARVLLVTTPYMLLAPAGYLLSKLKKMTFAWDVRDLTWLYPRYTGKRTFGVDKVFELMMKLIARKAGMIVAPVQGIVNYFKEINSKTFLVPNGVSSEFLAKVKDLPVYSSEGRPLVLYAGLFGYMQGLSTLIDTAKKLPEYDFLLIGDGPERARLMEQSKNLSNVKFMPYVHHEMLLEYYKKATVCVSLLRPGEISQIAEPSKVWEYMAAGKPLVYCGQGPLAKFLEEKGLAVVCPPGDAEALAFAIKKVIDSPTEAEEMAKRARDFVEKERVRENILEDFVIELEKLLSMKSPI